MNHIGPRPEATIEAAFNRFHKQNPHVYDQLVNLARSWKSQRGDQPVGMKMLFEVLRWQVAMKTTGDDFKLNNNYHSYYARMIMAREHDLRGIFQTRRLAAVEPKF
jgi:hypothetical protein